MKIFGVDLSKKHIILDITGERYTICFSYSLLKGIYDISVYSGGNKNMDVKVLGSYPPLKDIIYELRDIYFLSWLKKAQRRGVRGMARSEYRDTSDKISSMMYEAKMRHGIKDKELGKRIDLSPDTLRHMRSQKTACNISFWRVMLIAQMAGYEIKFERRT